MLLALAAVGQQPSRHCLDPARPNPCDHSEVVCFLSGIRWQDVHYLRVWLREPDQEEKATNMGHRRNRSKEQVPGGFPKAIEGRMSWQPVHIRAARDSDPVLARVTKHLEKLAWAAAERRGWPMSLRKSEEDVFVAVYPEGRGFYHRHRDVLPYFSREIAPEHGDEEGAPASASGTSVSDLVRSMTTDASLYPQAHSRVVSVVVQLAEGEGDGAEYQGGQLNVLTGSLEEPRLALPHVNAVRRGAPVVTAPACPGDVIIHPAFSVQPAGGKCRPSCLLRTPPHLFPGPPEGLGLAYLPRSAALAAWKLAAAPVARLGTPPKLRIFCPECFFSLSTTRCTK